MNGVYIRELAPEVFCEQALPPYWQEAGFCRKK